MVCITKLNLKALCKLHLTQNNKALTKQKMIWHSTSLKRYTRKKSKIKEKLWQTTPIA